MVRDPTKCPRCGAKLEWIDGWREYGDQLVEVQVEGCMKCGYLIDMELDEEDDKDYV